MGIIGDTVRWFTTSAHWHGANGIPTRLGQHVSLSLAVVITAMVIALPIGLLIGHTGRGSFLAINVSNIGRAVPSFAILVVGVQFFGLRELPFVGSLAAYIALVLLAIPPMITNTYTGMRQVDADVREAATGVGMSGPEVLRKVEAPMALPLIMAGVRTAGVQVVATAALAAVVGSGGLGRYVIDGLAQRDTPQLLGGAILVALLSAITEFGLAFLQRLVTPVGLRRARGGPRKVSALPGAASVPAVGEAAAG